MQKPPMQQQFDNLQKDVNHLKKINARKAAIENHVQSTYGDRSPAQHAEHLLKSLKDRYTNNTAIWKRMIRQIGSAYESARIEFDKVKTIREVEARARKQMGYNILSVFAGASLCWIAPALKRTAIFNKTFTSQGARIFFSAGFQEVIKKSAIRFTKSFPEITYQDATLIDKDREVALSNPLEFQNSLINKFEYCEEQIQQQLSDMIDDFGPQRGKAGPAGDLTRRYAYDSNDFSLSDRQIIEKIDGPYREIDKLVKEMNEHSVKTAFYFREKPAFDIDAASSNFKRAMAFRFERAMWAAWIPFNLRRLDRSQEPASRTFTALSANKPFTSDHFSARNLQNLKPGYYSIPGNPDYVMRVYERYEKPGRTLEKRLEYLQVIKSKEMRPSPFPHHLRQLEPFGCVTEKSDIKRLIAWAQTELENPYRNEEFKIKTREPGELYIQQLA